MQISSDNLLSGFGCPENKRISLKVKRYWANRCSTFRVRQAKVSLTAANGIGRIPFNLLPPGWGPHAVAPASRVDRPNFFREN
jgi:hypothetical protein